MRISLLLPVLLPLAGCFETKSDDDDDDDGSADDGGGWDAGGTDSGWTGSTDDGPSDDDTDTDTDGSWDTDADTDTDGSWDTDADTDTDGGGGGGDFDPYFVLFETNIGLYRGGLESYVYDGVELPNYFGIRLISDGWADSSDDDHQCFVYWFQYDLDESTGCTDCFDGMAWEVDLSSPAGTDGRCDDLDPTAWGDDVAETLEEWDLAHGFRPLDGADNEDDVRDAYVDYWDEYGEHFLVHSVAIGGEWSDLNTAFAYEVSAGEVVDDGGEPVLLPVDGLEAAPPTAWYNSSFFYGFRLE